jgi:hypothetical protein
MKLPAKSVAWLLPFFLTACIHLTGHKPVQTLPPSIHAAIPAEPVELPDSMLTIPSQPLVSDDSVLPQQTPRPIFRHKKLAGDTQEAAGENPGVSAIGQLSSGDPPDLWRETVDSITDTERGLKSIHRTLNTQERKTAAQIRRYLKQAKQALTSGDVDGAHTLAAKAKVLLSELTHT